ncbi:MAG: hypothetical protein IJJ25_03235 [Lachnospiraceae bacterium]|nr:hypothetical protein [Lachnospiraceae bacterium]
MKGMDSFEINREITLEELAAFMQANWNREEYGDFVIGDPASSNPDPKTKYIILPASESWCVIIYPKSGGLFKKKSQIKAACTYTSAGAGKLTEHGAKIGHYETTGEKIRDAKNAKELNQEMNTVADGIMRTYMDHLRELMDREGMLR